MPLSTIKQIISQNYSRMNAWKIRSNSGRHHEKVCDVRKILDILSGGNIVFMLKQVLKKHEKICLIEKYSNALKNFSVSFKRSKPKFRHNYVRPLKLAKFSRREAISLGFKASPDLWESCLDDSCRDEGGRPKNPTLKNSITQHMEKLSHISATRFLKRQNTQAFIRESTITEAYLKYIEDKSDDNKICFSTFCRNIDKKFKKPNALTDLCDFCEYNRELKSEVLTLVKQHFNYEKDTFDRVEISQYLCNLLETYFATYSDEHPDLETFDYITDKLKHNKELEFHRQVSDSQREVYNLSKTNKELISESILIDIDFKQKIVLGHGPRELNSEFYNREKSAFLGFGVHFLDCDDKIKCHNIDVVFEDKSTDGFTAVQGFKLIRTLDEFKAIDKKKYVIWTDCGPHFRCKTFAHFLFVDLAKTENIHISWNFFGEKHGKNSRDQHFSCISNFLKAESYVKNINTHYDVVDAIQKRQAMRNKARISMKLDPILHTIVPFDAPKRKSSVIEKQIEIDNFQSYYNFTTDQSFVMKTTVLSNYTNLLDVKTKDNEITKTIEPPEKIEKKDDDQFNFTRFITKRYFIENKLDPNRIQGKTCEEKEIKERDFTNSVMPTYCNNECKTCNIKPYYDLNQIQYIDIKKASQELLLHGHPSSRKIKGKWRNTAQSREELIKHYTFIHNMHLK